LRKMCAKMRDHMEARAFWQKMGYVLNMRDCVGRSKALC